MGTRKLGRVKIGIIIGLSVLLILLIVQNSVLIPGRFLWFSGEVSAVVPLILSATVGLILGLYIALFIRRDERERPKAESADPANDR